jgi:hypothetical protein
MVWRDPSSIGVVGQSAMTVQDMEFAGRLQRIAKGQGSFKHTLFVGAEDVHQVTYRQRGQSSGHKRRFGRLRKVVLLPTALALAVAGCLGAKVAMHMAGLGAPTEKTIDAFMGAEFAVGMILSTLLGITMRLRIQDFLLLRTVAVVLSMVALHNVVHAAPQAFRTLPGGWADTVLNSTSANTLIVRGATIAF